MASSCQTIPCCYCDLTCMPIPLLDVSGIERQGSGMDRNVHAKMQGSVQHVYGGSRRLAESEQGCQKSLKAKLESLLGEAVASVWPRQSCSLRRALTSLSLAVGKGNWMPPSMRLARALLPF